MTSFFFIFLHQSGTRCPQRVGKQMRLRRLTFPRRLGSPEFHPPAARSALNVPLFEGLSEGLSPTRGENSTSPVIKLSVSNLPLNTNVPASRPTLPIGNSTAPANVREFPSPRVHFASEGLTRSQKFDRGSSNRKEPFPEPRALKRKERLSPFVNVISTFQLPIMSGDSARDRAAPHICANTIRINAGLAVTITAYCRFGLS